MKFLNRYRILFLVMIACFCTAYFSACKKKKNDVSYVPYVYVDFYCTLSNPQFVALNAVGGWVYVTGGSRGIILYRNSNDEVQAFDRHCPFQPESSCGYLQVKSAPTAIDTCCGSEFLLVDGSVLKQPAANPMLRYQTTFDGNQVHVFN